MLSRALGAAALVALVSTQAPARADDKDGAERFERGVTLYQAGAFEGALIEFEAAYKATGNYRILFNIALCKMEGRDSVGSLAAFRKYLAEGGDRIDATKRATVEAYVKKLEPTVAPLTIRTDAPAGSEVFIDEERVGTAPLSGPIVLKVGRHRVAIRSGSRQVERTIEVATGEAPSVELSLPPAGSAAPERTAVASAPVSPTSTPATNGDASSNVGPIVTMVVGGATLVLGGVIYAVGTSRHASLSDDLAVRSPGGIVTGTTQREASEANDAGETLRTVGVIGMGVGVAVAASGVAWWAFGTQGGSKKLAVSPLPGGTYLSFSQRF